MDAVCSVQPTHLQQDEFEALYALLGAKLKAGEPALGRLVGKEALDLSDEWLHAQALRVSYVAFPAKMAATQILFEKGSAVDCCYVVSKGSLRGAVNGKTVCFWGPGDVIGLNDLLLSRNARPLTALIEPTGSDDPLLAPLLIRVTANVFSNLKPREFSHFLSGALRSVQAMALYALASQHRPALASSHVKVLQQRATQRFASGAAICEVGEIVRSMFYVVKGVLASGAVRYEEGSLVLLSEYLASDGRVAHERLVVVSKEEAELVALGLEDFLQLLEDSQFNQRVLDCLRILEPVYADYEVALAHRGQTRSSQSQVLLAGRLSPSGLFRNDAVISLGRSSDALPSSSRESSSRTFAIYETVEGVVNLNFCVELCHAFKRDAGSAVLISGEDFDPGYAMTLSDLANASSLLVGQIVRQARLNHRVCLLYVPLLSSRAWARECACAADTVLLVGWDSEEQSSERHKFPQGTHAVIPLSSPLVEREFVLLRKREKTIVDCSRFRPSFFQPKKFHHVRVSARSDVTGLCRKLAGRSVALVLGGHAEGVTSFVYLGVLEAFRFHGIPIDIIGGCFTGAAVAAMYGLRMSSSRFAVRLKRMTEIRHSIFDPLLDPVVSLFDSGLTFANRIRRSVETTYSVGNPNDPSMRRSFHVNDMSAVSAFFASATHNEYCYPAILDQGCVGQLLAPALRLPMIMPGSLMAGSFSNPLPIEHARKHLGAWKVFSIRVNVPISGDARGGPWFNWLIDGAAHACVSHLAVSASLNNVGGAKPDFDIPIPSLDDVEADEFHRAQEMCRRGFDAADAVLSMLTAAQLEELAAEPLGTEKQRPAMEYAILPHGRNYRKMLKVSALLGFAVIMFLLVRNKAVEAEQARVQEFLEGELHVHTEFVESSTGPV